MVTIDLAFLHDVRRSKRVAQDILRQLRDQVGLRICDHLFADVAEAATFESADEKIRHNYPPAVW
jgi:hypothetical protein